MTVGALIARLSDLDPDLRVVMPSEDELWCEVAEAFEDIVCFEGGTAQLADENDCGAVRVARLFGT